MIKNVNERRLSESQSAVASVTTGQPEADSSAPEIRPPSVSETSDRARLISLLRKRLRRFSGLLAEVLGEQTPESVHDLRVWSRRLQQTLAALFPQSRARRLRTLRRTLRDSRRALGPWRNCDVVLQRLERKQRQTRSAEKRRAWALVVASVRKSRRREIRRARKRLVRLGLFELTEDVETLLKAPGPARQTAEVSPVEIVAPARAQWQEALTRALEDRRPENIHRFRIETKRLRYRIELLRDLGAKDTAPSLGWLRGLQDALGGWHDRLELGRRIADSLASPELLHDQPRVSIILLTELEKENRLAASELDELMHEASDSVRRAQFEAWIALHDAPPQQNIEPAEAVDEIPSDQKRLPTE